MKTWQQIWQSLEKNHAVSFARFVLQRFLKEDISQTAGSLTFTTLLALVPLLTIMLVVITAFPMFGDISAQFMDFINRIIVPSGASVVADYLNQFKMQAGKMTAVGIIAMVVTSLMLIQTIDQTFNRIWRVSRQRSLFVRLPVYWLLLTLGPILAGFSLSASGYVLLAMKTSGELSFFAGSLQFVWQIVFNAAILLLLYRIVPNCHVPLKYAICGALFTGALLELAKWGFGLYISNFNSYALVYGAFAVVPIFLVWLHLLWLIVLTGALITACADEWTPNATHDTPRTPTTLLDDAVVLLLLLIRAQEQGTVLRIADIHRDLSMNRNHTEYLLLQLAQKGYVAETKRGWLLQTSPQSIKIRDLFQQFVFNPENDQGSGVVLHNLMQNCAEHLDVDLLQLHHQLNARQSNTTYSQIKIKSLQISVK